MRTLPQLLLATAAGGIAGGPALPEALVAGAVAGVAPDVIDGWQRWLERPSITVTPDPLSPDPAMIAAGIEAGLRQAADGGRPCRVRLNPVPRTEGGFRAYALDVDARQRLVVAFRDSAQQAVVCEAGPACAHPALLLPLPLRVEKRSRMLLFSLEGERTVCRDRDGVAGAGHALPAAGLLVLAALLAGGWPLGLAAAVALGLHLLLDACGMRDWTPGWPFRTPMRRGLHLWRDDAPRVNAAAALVAAILLLALMRA